MTVHIRTRHGKRGKTYEVRYRLGGRMFKLNTAGTFKTLREARTRRDLVGGWLAAGLDPRRELASLAHKPAPRTFAQLAEAYRLTRVDLAPSTRENMVVRIKRLTPLLAERDIRALTPGDIQEIVGALAAELAPGSVRNCLQTLRLILDFAEIEPNPARHRSVKAPREASDEVAPPPAAHVLAILRLIPHRFRLPLITLEQTAMRIGELEALAWGDVDAAGSRFRLRSSTTKTSKPRWVQVPEWLMATIEETRPREDRLPELPVFPGFQPMAIRAAMRRACVAAGIPHYHPHDLRHRRASLWHGQGVVGAEVARRGGWAKPTVPIDIYSHVMPLEEVSPESLGALLVRPR